MAGVPISFLPLAPQALDVLRRLSAGRPPRAKTESQTADLSIHGVRISDLITGRIFATSSLWAASEWAEGGALTGRIWSILDPLEPKADFGLPLGNEWFSISEWFFASYSEEFRSDREAFKTRRKHYDKPYRPEICRLFFDARQDRPSMFLVTNCLEFRQIAADFKAHSIVTLVDDLIAQHSDDSVFPIEKLACERRNGQPADEMIAAAFDIPAFASLDLDVLTRIVARGAGTLRNNPALRSSAAG
jgi:hypothetical protein